MSDLLVGFELRLDGQPSQPGSDCGPPIGKRRRRTCLRGATARHVRPRGGADRAVGRRSDVCPGRARSTHDCSEHGGVSAGGPGRWQPNLKARRRRAAGSPRRRRRAAVRRLCSGVAIPGPAWRNPKSRRGSEGRERPFSDGSFPRAQLAGGHSGDLAAQGSRQVQSGGPLVSSERLAARGVGRRRLRRAPWRRAAGSLGARGRGPPVAA